MQGQNVFKILSGLGEEGAMCNINYVSNLFVLLIFISVQF